MDTKAMKIPELISKILEIYKGLGYIRQSVDRIRSVYKELARYCTQHNELTYSLDLCLLQQTMAITFAKN